MTWKLNDMRYVAELISRNNIGIILFNNIAHMLTIIFNDIQ